MSQTKSGRYPGPRSVDADARLPSFSAAGLSIGQHTLWVDTDNQGNVAESNEANNWTPVAFTVTAPAQPLPPASPAGSDVPPPAAFSGAATPPF